MNLSAEVKTKAERKINSVFRAAISGEELFPWSVPLNRDALKDDLALWRTELEALRAIDKSNTGKPGPVIHNKSVNSRKFGSQVFPDKIVFETRDDLLGFLGKKREFERLTNLIQKTRDKFPKMETWLVRPSSPTRMLDNELIWDGILEVCRYLVTRDEFDVYPRMFPISVHSKFIEENKGLLAEILEIILPDERKNLSAVTFEERFRIKTDAQRMTFRIPDEVLRATLGIPFSELTVSTKELSDLLQRSEASMQFVVIENKTNYLSFPNIPGTIVIFGSGFMVGSLERHRFLERGLLYYWGDIDAHGLEILSLMREQFSHTEAFLMSEDLLEKYWMGNKGKPSSRTSDPTALRPAELKLYRLIKGGEKRLEQEKIPTNLIFEAVQQLVPRAP